MGKIKAGNLVHCQKW